MQRPAPLPILARLVQALRDTGQPEAGFRALEAGLGEAIGHRLFTILLHEPEAGFNTRIHSSNPAQYPTGGRKPVNTLPWTTHLFHEGRVFIGHTAEEMAAIYPDHALLHSLGCDSILNLPVRFGGRTLGTVNLMNAERYFTEADAATGALFAALAAPGLLMMHQRRISA